MRVRTTTSEPEVEPGREAAQGPPGGEEQPRDVRWAHVGARLAWCRHNVLHCSGAELARRARVSQQRVSALERGEGGVSLPTLMKLAAACGRPLEWFWAGPPPQDAAPEWLEPELAELLHEMGPERRRALVEFLKRNPNLPLAAELAELEGAAA